MNIAHCESGGRRRIRDTEKKVRSKLSWNPQKDVKAFVQQGLHCIMTRNGDGIPRPRATALHGQNPIKVVHMDTLYMGPAKISKPKYVLVLKDDLTP